MTSQRSDNIGKLRSDGVFDVIVVGGGINGIGVYRDLVLQGLRVLLVERSDFSSGCSAAPSRMIHGGLRYLENGEFSLVRESLRERDALLKNAPHMVRPLPTFVPLASRYSGLLNSAFSFFGFKGKPATRGALPVKLGLMLYDWVTRKRRMMPVHRFKSRDECHRMWPDLTDDAICAAIYYDAWISRPERLCIELLKDVAVQHPSSIALNYADLQKSGQGYIVLDHVSGKKTPVSTKTVVNATGAWLDETITQLGGDAGARLVSGTKGSHLILDNKALRDGLNGHMVYYENSDRRICIAFPYLGKVLAGSTDIPVDKAGPVRCEEHETAYILDALRRVFPKIPVSEDDIVFSYSGIRPLPKSDVEFTGRISRGHFVKRLEGDVPQFCMIGGKWTTFRAFAEQTADLVLAELRQTRAVSTLDLPIGGGKGFPQNPDVLAEKLIAEYGVSRERADHLVSHYGAAARDVIGEGYREDAPLSEGCLYTVDEIAWLIEQEFVVNLSDIILRRTAIAITGQLDGDVIDGVCEGLARAHGLTDKQINDQRTDLIAELTAFHGVSADLLETQRKQG